MMSFDMLSASVRAFFAFWTLLLCLTNIGSAVFATVKKRYLYTAFALFLFIQGYYMWQVIFDLSLFGKTKKTADITSTVCNIPVIYWVIALVILTAAATFLFGFNIRYDKNFITPGTIKSFLDKMPCGICCWRKNGRVLFSNICMNNLCIVITGNTLLNGNQFRDALEDKIITACDKVWRFSCREIWIDGERLYEMIASDITTEYEKTEVLKKDKAELSRLNQELWEYYRSIDESVRRQEILQAKMNIHDEMNRLMLSTVATDKTDTRTLDNIFSLWEKNALLLCMAADNKTKQSQTDAIESLTNALGINLIWHGSLPSGLDDKQKELFSFTAQEAIINAVKHAQAKVMEISFENTQSTLNCCFTNDGKLPISEVCFEGGLANLAYLAEKQGATLQTEIDEKYMLVLKIKNQPIG